MDQPTSSPSNQSTHDHHWGPSQVLVTIVVIVLLLLLGLWLYNLVGKDEAPNEIITSVREGEVVEDFPRELILEANPEATQSYSIQYRNSDARQPVVQYVSELSLQGNIDAFGAILAQNGWTVINHPSAGNAITSYYAIRGNEETNVTFSESEEGEVIVEVSYVVTGGQESE